ncbi:DUF2202 domain-containing protein [Spirilliplanes yamanashiensis]|uniref:DUF2202 domain-containing protein n=1 Tax=Spirilliplanes yamanashiensis TaxID=42233 RepID=A0A8J4DJK4_9ACTN|nr:DUF2202 domain-containing protein [Spirilliplanes yamanashiensis]MDP9817257.1 hypothetical protein [Spirilliplanes yamanashiensis]GIJ03090.1 hypothetical protein Sya03_24420 [Spirilliplanes yamanashiensis]
MRATTTRRTVGLVAAGVIGLGGIAVAGPALAGAGMFAATRSAPAAPGPGSGYGHHGNGYGHGMGAGMGTGMGTGMGAGYGMGSGMGAGACPGAGVTAPQGTLTDRQKSTLAAMAQEEKLAHDLYLAFAGRYPLPVFDHIAAAEAHHLATVRALLARYGTDDPTAGRAAGTFSDPAVQATYDRLLARGSAGRAAALTVGQEVERTDIADLRRALTGLTAPDVTQAYQHLLRASERHLAAFTAWAGR